MSPTMRPTARATLFASLMTLVVEAHAQMTGLNPTAVEVAQLPRFCWGQMNVPNAAGPQYNLGGCGWGMNHYCPGLIKLIRAKTSVGKERSLPLLRAAAGDIRYTEQAIKGFPDCPIRSHVAASRAEVTKLMAAYGEKPPAAP
jgi:hypothetical protein